MAAATIDKEAIRALENRAGATAELLKVLANDQRLIILCRLSDDELAFSELGEYVNLAQSALSQHLAKLRAHGLVTSRREGQNVYYRLANPMAQRLVGAVCKLNGGR